MVLPSYVRISNISNICVYVYPPLKKITVYKKKKKKKQAPDLLVLLVEHLLDHHTGEEPETGYFL